MFQSFKGKCTALLMMATICWIALPCLFMERQSNSRVFLVEGEVVILVPVPMSFTEPADS